MKMWKTNESWPSQKIRTGLHKYHAEISTKNYLNKNQISIETHKDPQNIPVDNSLLPW